tara:strand:- start:2800 stop:3528 length:729 start_codon:yes stop_codon:yes gene_type:complete
MISKDKNIYLFDIDGTLTEPLSKMDSSFTYSFLSWMADKKVFLVGGSDFKKISLQVPQSVISRCSGIFSCMGNELRTKEGIKYQKEWKAPVKLLDELLEIRKSSRYENKRSKYIESRRGMINFSVAGRDSSEEERKDYFLWDQKSKERIVISKNLKRKFPELDICIGGMISLDIQPRGWDKAQAVDWIKSQRQYENCKMFFFGDKCHNGGNDESLFKRVTKEGGEAYNVEGPKETLEIISRL